MTDCPNCGERVEPGAALCGSCGFDLHTSVAGEVRRLHEEGRIKPGRLNPRERSVTPTGATAGEGPRSSRAEHFDAGL